MTESGQGLIETVRRMRSSNGNYRAGETPEIVLHNIYYTILPVSYIPRSLPRVNELAAQTEGHAVDCHCDDCNFFFEMVDELIGSGFFEPNVLPAQMENGK
jgi:hypothetical protein